MRQPKLRLSLVVSTLTTLTLLLSLIAGSWPVAGVMARSDGGHSQDDRKNSRQAKAEKVSPDLRARQRNARAGDDSVSVILQLNDEPSGQLNALLNRDGVHVKAHFENFNSQAVELPLSAVEELAAYPEVEFVSADRQVVSLGHLSVTTGSDMNRSIPGSKQLLDGTGVGIAIVDSGLDPNHLAFNAQGPGKAASRIKVSKDFTGEGRTDDPFGHGTHVAAAAAASSSFTAPVGSPASTLYPTGAYKGIAYNANLINLRVLNSQGRGTASGLLSALNWVMTNRLTYNIRVVNLSLGMPAIDSYRNDPVCKAVRSLVNAGVVVVAAAGNNGKDEAGNKVYGQIHAPGNEPSAITVGAANTFGTDARSDDTVTTYSSRGPTRSFWTDASGVNHHDNLIKPDLVAPGNKIVSAEAANCRLVKSYPQMDVPTNYLATPNGKAMYMSGSSVAAPVVAGTAALMLQANPRLTPNMVKALLMYTAQQLPGANMFEQGAGELNVEGALRVAKLVCPPASQTVGAPLLNTSTPPTPQSTILTQTVTWSQGLVMGQTYATGVDLITKYQKIYGLGVVIGDGVTISEGVTIGDSTMFSYGVVLGDHVLTANGTTIGAGVPFFSSSVLMSDGVIMGDGVLLTDGVIIGDGVLLSDGALMTDGVIMGDYNAVSQAAMANGDDTACMY